tara:strand:+ start:3427 stop:4083 length:657 start_codon:yes stop_codon:yes gene_type:complete
MTITIQTYIPTANNEDKIFRLSCALDQDDRGRFENSVKQLVSNQDGFNELHLLLIDKNIVGFLALKGSLPCNWINDITLETVYVLISEPFRGQKLSHLLIGKYTQSISNWTISSLKTFNAENHQELVFHLVISPVSKKGSVFQKKSVVAAYTWCTNNIQKMLNDKIINPHENRFIIFDWGLGPNYFIFPKEGSIEKINRQSALEIPGKKFFEIAQELN